jgi:hypothetical protein
MSFAEDFRDQVIPRMRLEARVQGLLVAAGEIEFGDAKYAVTMIAVRAGLGLLSPEAQERVTDRVPDLLWDAHEAGLKTILADERKRRDDPIGYFESAAAKCRDPEKMRWVFAAMCPAYRKHLVGRMRKNVR